MRSLLAALALCIFPSTVWAYVPHEYPAIYTHQLGGVFYLIALSVVLWVILKNRLQREKGWRYFFLSVIFFLLWDTVIVTSRFLELALIEPSQTIGSAQGWEYFTRKIDIEGAEILYYLGRFDFILLNIAMILFYVGLREHLESEEQRSPGQAAALLPLLPILLTDMAGNVVFIILSIMSLATSVKLYRKDRENPLWSYMVWLSSSYLLFSISRSFGHILRHILLPTGNQHIWGYLDGITGSLNTSIRFLVASLTLFFIWTYKIYNKVQRDKDEIELVNLDLTELNQELETLVAERTMTLMGLTVADRVRNPAMLIGCACKRIVDKEKKLGADLQDVIDECKKLETIVGDFETLLKSRRSLFKYEDVNDIVKGVIAILDKEVSGKGVRVVMNLSAQPVRINTQKTLLRAAIYHVLRNALEASPRGGEITVATSQDREHIFLSISDTGPGIAQEDADRIFEPFFSTKKMRFGMGLPLVKQIVAEHLGEVKMESELGKGTTFTMVFPVRWLEKKQSQVTT